MRRRREIRNSRAIVSMSYFHTCIGSRLRSIDQSE